MLRYRNAFPVLIALCLLSACSGGSGGGTTSLENTINVAAGKTQHTGLSDSRITVFNSKNLREPICETQAVDGNIKLEGCIHPGEYYWIEATGNSSDLLLCTIISADALANLEDWHISKLTDALCQSVHSKLSIDGDQGDLSDTLNRVAATLLTTDIDNSGAVDALDTYLWKPGTATTIDRLIENSEFRIKRTDPFGETSLSEVLIARLDTQQPVHKVIVQGNTAYAISNMALLIIDISKPAEPAFIAAYPSGWIHDLALLGSTIYLAMGKQGVALIDVSNTSNPQRSTSAPVAATALASHGDSVFYIGKDDEDIAVGLLTNDGSQEIFRERLPVDVPLLFKVVEEKLHAITTTFTESTIHVFDTLTNEKLHSKSLQDDYGMAPTTLVNDVFYGMDWMHFATSPPYPGLELVHVKADDYSLIGSSWFFEYSLIEKNGITLTRTSGLLTTYEEMQYRNPKAKVSLPDDIQWIYFKEAFETLNANPLAAFEKLFGTTGYIKRFQLSTDNEYLYHASDRYGFSILHLAVSDGETEVQN